MPLVIANNEVNATDKCDWQDRKIFSKNVCF